MLTENLLRCRHVIASASPAEAEARKIIDAGYTPNWSRDGRRPVYENVIEDGAPLSGIVTAAAGEDHSMALDGAAGVWTWGSNQTSQLGRDGSRVARRLEPFHVSTGHMADGGVRIRETFQDGGPGSLLDGPEPIECVDRPEPHGFLPAPGGFHERGHGLLPEVVQGVRREVESEMRMGLRDDPSGPPEW